MSQSEGRDVHIPGTNTPLHYIITKLKIWIFLPYLHQIHEQIHLLKNTPPPPLCNTLQIPLKNSNSLHKFHFIWYSLHNF